MASATQETAAGHLPGPEPAASEAGGRRLSGILVFLLSFAFAMVFWQAFSASGVVRRGDYVYVIGDDELHVGVFRLSSSEPGRLRQVLRGELPDDAGERAQAKPDLEALTVLPPFEEHPYGALLGLGSGSAPGRDRGVV